MKKKRGFVFIETIVVVAVLTVSLLMIYSTYSATLMKEKTRIKNNDSAYLYRTYYLEKFFRNFRMDVIATELTGNRVLTNFGCHSAMVFINEEDNVGFCDAIWDDLNISNMYLTLNDLSFLQNCTNSSGRCEALVQVNDSAASYLKTIGGKGLTGYRIILEFAENKDGSQCTGDKCQYYYATLSLGEL